MDNEPEIRQLLWLQFFELGDHGNDFLRARLNGRPVSKKTVPEILVYDAVMRLCDLLASREPRTENHFQPLVPHALAKPGEIPNICDKQPAGNIFDFTQSLFRNDRFVFLRDLLRLTKSEDFVSDCDLIAVPQSNRVMNALLVLKGPVAAAEIDQPEFADVLQMNQRVSSRHFGGFEHDVVRGGSSERRTSVKRVALAIGRFQPGTFLLGCVHAERFYQGSW